VCARAAIGPQLPESFDLSMKPPRRSSYLLPASPALPASAGSPPAP